MNRGRQHRVYLVRDLCDEIVTCSQACITRDVFDFRTDDDDLATPRLTRAVAVIVGSNPEPTIQPSSHHGVVEKLEYFVGDRLHELPVGAKPGLADDF